jgi:hypothetical protein
VIVLLALVAGAAVVAAPPRGGSLPGLELGDKNLVGVAFQVDNLTIFPIYATDQPDIGDIITLDEAIRKGKAVVKEVGAASARESRSSRPARENRYGTTIIYRDRESRHHEPDIQIAANGAVVNTLVIQNLSGTTILVLAGTVVVGGKQDRQVGQDFIVPPWKTVPIDAFCVEHGRWQATRQGQPTGGTFGAVGMLANQRVRAAGQYKGDQTEVWAEVSNVNRENAKSASTGTLLATLADGEVARDRSKLVQKLDGYLQDVPHRRDMVGLAYAVDGRVRGARWFINRDIYVQFEDTLIATMANEALTAQSAALSAGRSIDTSAVAPSEVQDFVEDLRKAKVTESKKTAGGNENTYREGAGGYSSECVIEKAGKAAPVTSDYLSK